MLYMGREYAIEAFVEQSSDRERLPEHHPVLYQYPDNEYDVSSCSLECVEGKISCYIDAEDREVDGVYLRREQRTWTFRQMSYEDDIGEIVIADMQFATRPTTDCVEEAEVTGQALAELCKITLEIQEGELIETGVMVKGKGSAAAASAGTVYEANAKLGSTVVGANARPARTSEFMGTKFIKSINPKICRMVWKYGTRDTLIIKGIIRRNAPPSAPRYVDSDYSNDEDPSDSDHDSDDLWYDRPLHSSDNEPGPSTRPARRPNRKRKVKNESGDDSADDDFKPDHSDEDIKPRSGGRPRSRSSRASGRMEAKGKGRAKDGDEGEEGQVKKPRAISTRTRSKKWGQPDSDEGASGPDGDEEGVGRAASTGASGGRAGVNTEDKDTKPSIASSSNTRRSRLLVKLEDPDQERGLSSRGGFTSQDEDDFTVIDPPPKTYIMGKHAQGEIIDLTEDD